MDKPAASGRSRGNEKVSDRPAKKAKLTYKEQKELEQLEKDMAALAEEKAELEKRISSGDLAYDQLQKASERIGEIISLNDEKEMRWLELSMKAEN